MEFSNEIPVNEFPLSWNSHRYYAIRSLIEEDIIAGEWGYWHLVNPVKAVLLYV
jgi:hypothetical protein